MQGKLEVYIGQVMGNDVEKISQGLIIRSLSARQEGLNLMSMI